MKKKMMTVIISEDEWYPVFRLDKVNSDWDGSKIEIPEELYLEAERIEEEFRKLQEKLSRL